MTNELEKQFFSTFGIPKIYKTTINIGDLDYNPVDITAPTLKKLHEEAQIDLDIPFEFKEFKNNTDLWEHDYPQITDRILLELIVLHSVWCMPRLCCFNLGQLKEQLLSDLCLFNCNKSELIHQVRTLFEEGK